MPSVDEMILSGMDEDLIADQILQNATKKKPDPPTIDIPAPAKAAEQKPMAPKVEVVQPNRKLLVVFPAGNRADIHVAAYEDVQGGGRKVLEQWRKPTDYERRHLVNANKEILSGGDGATDAPGEENKLWKYGKWVVGGVALLGGSYAAARHFGLIGDGYEED